MNGKGSKRRPEDLEVFIKNYDEIDWNKKSGQEYHKNVISTNLQDYDLVKWVNRQFEKWQSQNGRKT